MDYRDGDDDGEGLSYMEREAIVQVAQACASLSFLGSAVIVVANFRFKQLRTYSFQLVVWLAVCDMFANLSYFLGSHIEGSVLCYTQAIVQQFFQVAVIQWTLLISHSLLVMASSTRAFEGDKRMPWNHLWAWGISAVLTIGPVCTGSYGESDCTFCWIKSGDSWNEGSCWRTIFLVMVFLSMVAIVWMYVTVVKHLGRTQRGILLLSSHATKVRRESSVTYRGQKRRKSSKTSATSSVSLDAMLRPTSSRPDVPLPFLLGPLHLSDRSEASPSLERAETSEDNGGEESQPRAPRATSLWKRWVKGDDSGTSDGERSVDMERQRSNDSQSSLFSLTRSNSQISAKDWLWSTSREAGFFGDKDVSDREGEERENALWLNSSATAARNAPGALDQGRASKPLPTLPESGLSTNATTQVMKGIDCLTRAPWRRPSRASIQEQQTPPILNHEATKARAASPCTAVDAAPSHRSGKRNAVGSAALDCYVGRSISERLSATAAPPSAGSSCNADAALADTDSAGEPDLASTRKTRFTYRVGKARGFVRRMSSIDLGEDYVEHGLGHGGGVGHGGVDTASGEAGRRGSAGPAGPAHRDTKVTLLGPGSGDRGTLTKHSQGSSRRGNMDKFISRVKWYPVIYVLCWIFTLINGSYTVAVGAQNASFTLVMLATVTSRLQGLLNFLWYGLNDSLKQAWLQDFLYRKAVASCCRALWCCCSGPCCPKCDYEDERDVSADDVSHVAHAQDEARSSSANSIDLAESMERGTGVGAVAASSSSLPLEATPTSSAWKWVVPCATPSVPKRLQGLVPKRPVRPSRNAANRPSQKKTSRTRGVQKSMAVSASRFQARTAWRNRSVLSRPARAFYKAGITPPRFHLKNRKRYGKGLNGGKRVVSTLTSALPIAVSMPVVTPSVQLGSSPSQSSAYSSSSGSDFFLEGTVGFRLSGYIRDRAGADCGGSRGEDEHERGGDGDSSSVGSGSTSSTSVDDDGPSVPGGNRTGGARNGSARPGGLTDTTPVEGRAADFITRSSEEAGPFSEYFGLSREGCGERKEPL